ncbi:hypothetical protein J14TS2_47030 [Bacillus sp. J14TS2]|uniref:hypothetical protein n=1 Tax=Bacillus sp. J14TS2 TaxID=2807188 RepID=UPI001B03D03C|nr:hypothetical protein [Bacillus sp. J14TS2]GIN74228.1 hypothetical protein J14TS2_47030 [Bacillus sp. J14TS2]
MQKIAFGKELAKTIGLNESIVLEKLNERVEKEGTPLDGRVWIERTYEEWQEDFSFWSIATIKRTFASLKRQGLIQMEQHGKHRYDRTNWYTLSEKGCQCFVQEKTAEEKPETDEAEDIQEKVTIVEKQLKKLDFFPLHVSQIEELTHACKTFSLKQILQAIEATAERAIFAWKYAYKILLTNQKANTTESKRKIIRTEKVPDWFQHEEHKNAAGITQEWNAEMLAKKRRLQEIQEKYQKQKKTTFSYA